MATRAVSQSDYQVIPLTEAGTAPELERGCLLAIFKAAVPGLPVAGFSESGSGFGYVGADLTTTYRATSDVVGLGVKDAHPGTLNHDVGKLIASPEMTLVYQASGTASFVNAFHWAEGLARDPAKIGRADAIGDRRGGLLGRLSVLKNGSGLIAGSALGGGFRISSMVGTIQGKAATGFHASSLVGRVSYSFLFIGLTVFSLFNTVVSIICGISIYEGEKLRKKLSKSEDPIGYLLGKLSVDEAAFTQKLVKKLGADKFEALLEKEALKLGKKGIRAFLKENGLKPLSNERIEALVRQVAASAYGSEKPLQELGFNLLIEKQQAKKIDKLKRAIGGDLFNRIGDPSLTVEEINKKLTSNLRLNLSVIAILTLSTAALIAAIVCTGGGALVFSAILMLLSSVTMLGLDVYCLRKSLKEKDVAAYDRRLIAFSSLLSVASLATVVTLMGLGVLSFGTVPLVTMIAISLLWLAYNGYVWKKVKAIEDEKRDQERTLENFERILIEEGLMGTARANAAFNQLDDKTRASLKSLERAGKTISEAIESLKEERKAERLQQQEAYRRILTEQLNGV